MVSAHISFRLRAIGVRADLRLFLPLLLEDLEVPDRCRGRVTPGQEHLGDVPEGMETSRPEPISNNWTNGSLARALRLKR